LKRVARAGGEIYQKRRALGTLPRSKSFPIHIGGERRRGQRID